MRGKNKSWTPRRNRGANARALSTNVIQNGHPTSNQNPELVSFIKTILPLWVGIKDPVSKGNNSTQLESDLNNFFKTYSNPLEEYLDFLELVISNDSWSSSGSSFSVYCTKVFNLFLCKVKDPNPVELSNDVKLRAIMISSRSMSYDLKKLIFNVYKFADSPELLKIAFPQIKKNGLHTQSSQWIHIFNAEDQFEMCEYLFPMLLEKNIENISNYLKDHPDKLNGIVKLIDNLGKDRRAIQSAFTEFLGRNFKKSEVLTVESKTFKMIKFCIKKFNISPELTPNYNQRNEELEINFYVHSFSKDEMSEEAFEERVIPLCEANPALQDFLIKALSGRLYEQAQKFSKIFNKPMEEIPNLLPRERSEVIEYYSLDCLVGMTVIVDSEELCKSMLQYIDTLISANAGSKSTIPVGLDLEWKSVCTAISTLPPALFQVAFDKRVYIVDVNKLHSNTDFWTELNDKLLKNEKFSKLGYGLQNDQGNFNYYPNLGFISMKGLGYIDLNKEERKYTNSNNPNQKKFTHNVEESKYKTAKGQRGLSRLVYYCFGMFLDKREVLSDWNRRPLRKAQLSYAAMDAYCLLKVYKVLDEMHKETGNNFDSATASSKKPNIIPERANYRRPWGNQFMKRRFWYRKKKEAAVQASVECTTVSTQTQSNL